jgi:hypothetical protein
MTPMKTDNLPRRFLWLASLLSGAAAFAQNAGKPALEEVYVRGEFHVNTATDDSFIAPGSASGTRTGACGARSGYAVSGGHSRTAPVHFAAFTGPTRAVAAAEIIAGNRLRVQAPSVKRPNAVLHAGRARPIAPFSPQLR